MAPDRGFEAQEFTNKARDDLVKLFADIPGRKDVVFEKSLVGPIELLVPFSKLKEQGVEKPFFLENDNTVSSQRTIVYLARAEKPQQPQAIANQIKRLQQTSQVDHDFHVIWVPRRTLLGDKILDESGVTGDITTHQLPIFFLQPEPDLFSLELDSAFEELYLDKDPTSVFAAAKALMQFQKRYGLFPHIAGKGDNARRLADLIIKMRHELATDERSNSIPSNSNMPSQSIERLIIIDRETDFATALMTQLTYEGLVDETFTIDHGKAELDVSIVGQVQQQASSSSANAPSNQPRARAVRLTSEDPLFASIRDAHFTSVGSLLNRTARRLQTDYSSNRADMSTSELRTFIAKLPGIQSEAGSLKLHTSLLDELLKSTRGDLFRAALRAQQGLIAGADVSSVVNEDIEELAARAAPLTAVLRLLCLASVMAGGLKAKDFDAARRLVVQAYGHQHILTLDALEKMGLLTSKTPGGVAVSLSSFNIPGTGTATSTEPGAAQAPTKSSYAGPSLTDYAAARRSLQLIMEDVNEEDPTDVAYTYSGYAPLSVRLVQAVLQKQYIQSLTRSGLSAAAASAVSGLGRSSTTSTDGAATPTAQPPTGAASSSTHTVPGGAWRGFDAFVASAVRGATFDLAQTNANRAAKARETLVGHAAANGAAADGAAAGDDAVKTTIVFFVGGLTFAELAALRFVGRQLADESSGRRRLLVGTTGMLSGERMMKIAIHRSQVASSHKNDNNGGQEA